MTAPSILHAVTLPLLLEVVLVVRVLAMSCFCCVVQVLLILQYSYLTAARCLCIPGNSADISGGGSSSGGTSGCVWVLNTDPTATRHVFDLLGLHTTSAGVLPLFLIYLALLMYNYKLGGSSSYQPGLPGAANSTALGGTPRQGAANSGAGAVVLVVALQGWVSKLGVLRRFVVHKLSYYLR